MVIEEYTEGNGEGRPEDEEGEEDVAFGFSPAPPNTHHHNTVVKKRVRTERNSIGGIGIYRSVASIEPFSMSVPKRKEQDSRMKQMMVQSSNTSGMHAQTPPQPASNSFLSNYH